MINGSSPDVPQIQSMVAGTGCTKHRVLVDLCTGTRIRSKFSTAIALPLVGPEKGPYSDIRNILVFSSH